MPVLSKRRSGKLSVSYQKPSLYVRAERLGLVRVEHRAERRVAVLQLGDRERAAVQGKARAGAIRLLRVGDRVVGRRAAVEDADQHRQRIDRARAKPDARRRQRIGRPAARQIRRRHHRPAEHGVDEEQRVLADHELLVEALLPDLDVEPVLGQEFLVVPQLPQARGAIGLDAARGLQRAEVVGATGCGRDTAARSR